jgi:NAD(P)-dependent dehydrogenase (short-subunit alcohol dehydrogenase family)
MDLSNRHVVVTGGTGALGTAVVAALLQAGGACHVPWRSATEALQFPFRDHPRVTLHEVADLADEDAVARFYQELPPPWAAIHAAGGFAFGALRDTGKAELMRQLETNLISCFVCCRAAVTAMLQAGGGGRIVNVAARPALEWRQGANMTAYTAAKAGVAALTVALAQEVVDAGILVNAVAPSIMDTPQNRRAMPTADPAGWPKADEVARTILFLASPDNTVTRGAVVPVYGRV